MNSLKTTITSLAVLLCLCVAQYAQAKQPHITAKFSSVAVNQTCTVYDQSLSGSNYTYLETHAPSTLGSGEKYWTNGSTTWYDKWVKNRVVLTVEPEKSCIDKALTVSVTVELKKYNWYSGSYTFQTEYKTLTVNYDPNNVFSKKAVYEFPAGYKLVSKITSISTSDAAYNPILSLETEFEAERYFGFNHATNYPTSLTYSEAPLDQKSEYLITWDGMQWAEEYDLEWTFIDFHSDLLIKDIGLGGSIGEFSDGSPIPADIFRFNSTRITTTNTFYNIPAVYGKGVILYRVRGYGKSTEDQFTQKVPGIWSTDFTDEQPLSAFTYFETSGHELQMNWQFATQFAEEGKNKVSLTYFDGSMRQRQEVTKMNTGILLWDETEEEYSREVRNTVVSEVMYDHQGRVAITVLPVPTDQEQLRFYDQFNRNLSDTVYNKSNYDIDLAPCTIAADPMSTDYGASNYYSPDNIFLTSLASPQINKTAEFIPDAQKYPFVHTQYMPDNTGKISAKGGAGGDHQIGSGHETKYYYGRPFQEEIDRLFGTEAGYAEHYKKHVTQDPNGQLSIIYLNMQDKAVATTMIGPKPASVSKVETNKSVNDSPEVDLLNKVLPADPFGKGETFSYNDRTRTLSQDFFVADEGIRNFRYKLINDKYTSICSTMVKNFCYECVLDLKISIKDECGVQYLNGLSTQGGSPVTSLHIDRPRVDTLNAVPISNCQESAHEVVKGTVGSPWKSNTNGSTPVAMKKGTYTLEKTLTVNQSALDKYTKTFLDSNQCLQTKKQQFITEEKGKIDTSFCTFDCSEWLARIGATWETSPLNPENTPGSEITEEIYKTLFHRYNEECDIASRQCRAAYEMMLQDVSPLGQYGEIYTKQARYDINGNLLPPNYQTFSPQAHPLSVFNENNYLPWKTLINDSIKALMPGIPGYWPSWRFPFNHNETSADKRMNYLDQDGNIAYVYLDRVGNDYIPKVLGDDYSLIEFYEGRPRILVKDLADVKDLVGLWDPAWAKALVVHHPEYFFYIDCISKVESNIFDEKWLNTQSVAEASDTFSIWPHSWSKPLGEYWHTSADTPYILDPFFNYSKNLDFANNPANPTAINATGTIFYNMFRYKLEHFIVFPPSWGMTDLTMQQVAIVLANCPDIDMTNCGAWIVYNCLNGRTEVSSPEEWRIYRQLYYSVKQHAVEALSVKKAIEQGYYNGCIGQEVFNMAKNWFYRAPYNAPGSIPAIPHPWFNLVHQIMNFGIPKYQFFNPEQPCNWGRYWLYKNKNVRYRQAEALYNLEMTKSRNAYFALKPDSLLNYGEDSTNYAIIDEVKKVVFVESYKANCGQCPVAENMVGFLNSLRQNSKLLTSYFEVKASCNIATDYQEITPELGNRIYPEYSYANSVQYKGESYTSGGSNYLRTSFMYENYGYTEKIIDYKFPAGSPYNASDIVRFCCIRGNTPGAKRDSFDFTVSVFVKIKSGDSLYTANDPGLIAAREAAGNPILREILLEAKSPFIDLIHCDNLPLCKPRAEASHMLNFLNAARDFTWYSTGNVQASVLRNSGGTMIITQPWQQTFTDAMAKILFPGTFNSYFDAYFWNASMTSSSTEQVVYGTFIYKGLNKSVKLTMPRDPSYLSVFQFQNIRSFNSIVPKLGYPNVAIIKATACSSNVCMLVTIEMDLGFSAGDCTVGLPDRLKSGEPANTNKVKPDIGGLADYGVVIILSPFDTTQTVVTTDSVPPGSSPCASPLALKNYMLGKIKMASLYYDSSAWVTEWNPCPFGHGWVARRYLPVIDTFKMPSPCDDCSFRIIFPGDGYEDANGNPMPYTMQNVVSMNEFRTISPGEFELDVTTNDGKKLTIRIRMQNCGLPDSVMNIIPGGGGGGGGGTGDGDGKCRPSEQLNFHNFAAYYSEVPDWTEEPYYWPPHYDTIPGKKYFYDAYGKDFATDLDTNRYYRFDTTIWSANTLSPGEYTIVSIPANYMFLNYSNSPVAMRYMNSAANTWDKVWETPGTVSLQKDIAYTFTVWHKEIFENPGDLEETKLQIFFADVQASTMRTVYRVGDAMWIRYDVLLLSTQNRSGKIRIETKGNGYRHNLLTGIQLLKDCGPTFCCPIPMPPMALKNPCHEQLESIALENARIRFEEYVKPIVINFQQGYIKKCLGVYEEFFMKYMDSEDHTTLYYYDQAGNLIRTVPPKGVMKITDAGKLARIKEDRAKGLRREFTDHEYKTTYTYNSLNQLQHQSMPDNENMPIWNTAVKTGIIPSGYTIKDVRFTDKLNGILVANHSSAGGRIYKTSDGGETWSEVNAFGLADLNSMVSDAATGARYVVGDNGLIMQYVNTGGTWKWNIRVLPTAEKLVKINLISSEYDGVNGVYNTRLWVHDENGTGWLIKCALNYPAMDLAEWKYEGPYTSLAGVATGKIQDVHIPLNSPFSASSLVGYAVTENGKVYRTDDEGYSWAPDISHTSVSNNLTAMHFNAANQGYIGGENGLLMKGALVSGTVSQPARWRIVPGNLNTNISKVHFIDGDKGFVLGADYNLYRTTNSGVTFTDLNIPDDVADFTFANNTTGAAVTRNGKVYRTIDAGITWTLYSQIMNGGSPFYTTGGTEAKRIRYSTGTSFAFMMVTGNTNVHISTVTGTTGTWSVLNVSTQIGSNTIKDLFLDQLSNNIKPNFLLSSGDIKTYTGSTATWTTLYTAGADTALKMFFTAYNKGAVLCWNNKVKYYNSVTSSWDLRLTAPATFSAFAYTPDFANLLGVTATGSIYASEGAGTTTMMNISSGIYMPKLNAVQCYTQYLYPTYSVAVGKSGLVMFGDKQISNNYTTWTVKKAATAADLNDVFYAGSQYTATGNNGVAFTQYLNTVPATVTTATTTDYHAAMNVNQVAGANGKAYNLATSTAYTTPVTSSTINDGTGDYVVGDNGYMAERVSSTYTAVNMVIPQKLNAVFFANASVGYTGGEAGSLWKTTNGGKSWKDIKIAALVGQDIMGISFLSETNGFVVATGGKIYKTTNGETFTLVTPTTGAISKTLIAIDINASGLGYIVGEDGTCIITTDAGANWSTSYISGTPDLNSVTVPDYNLGYACGDNSKLYKLVPSSSAVLLEQTPGSTSWPSFLVSAQRDLTDIHFIDRKTGYVTGASGFLMKTVDGGTIWKLEQSGTSDRINAFAQADEVTFYAGASAGEVSRISDKKDRYSIKLYYDVLGRLVVTQNTKQYNKLWAGVADHLYYSYTIHDFKGRVVEIGELHAGTPVESNYSNAGVLDHVKYNLWLNTATRTEITRTFYDVPEFSAKLPVTFIQNNLRNRVAAMVYYPTYSTDNSAYQSATHYSYDIHGNVSSLLQENTTLKDLGHNFKRIDYTYDLVSGKVMEVAYQHGSADRFYHRYNYDGENKITFVETSYDKIVWEKDAKYQYYLQGPASRVELGNDQVQGLDYAYTIQGWMKTVNGASLDVDAQNTIGNDGVSDPDNANRYFGKDEIAYELNYYNNDYLPINNTALNALADITGSNYESNLNTLQLYNGNISGMITSHRHFIAKGQNPLATAYRYDQLNRLKEASYHYTVGASEWLEMDDYRNTFHYDANGNIISQYRMGRQEEEMEMDDLTYLYYAGTNKLRRVDDAMPKSLYTDDIDDQLGGNNPVTYNNYEYDEVGNLIKDRAEEIDTIKWTVGGKISKIIRTSGSVRPDLEFIYDPSGNRIVKIVSPKTGEKLKVYTFYVRNAQGDVVSTYSRTYDKDLNYAGLNYYLINSQIVSTRSAGDFKNFLYWLHITNNNSNAGLFNNLKGGISGWPEMVEAGSPYYGGMIYDLGLFDNAYAEVPDNEIMYYYARGMGDQSPLQTLLEELCACYKDQHSHDPGIPGFVQLFFDQNIPGIGNNSAREIFLTYLYEYDNNALFDLTNQLTWSSYDFATDLDYLLNVSDPNDWETALNNMGFDDCHYISNVLANGFFNSATYSYSPLFGEMFAYLPGIKDALHPNTSTCGISYPDEHDASYFIGPVPNVGAYLVSNADPGMTDWLVDNAPAHMMFAASDYDLNIIGAAQHSTSGIYGGVEGYFNLIRTYFGDAYYQSLRSLFMNSYPAYLDKLKVNEQYVYGSSRVGSYHPKNLLTQVKFTGTLSNGNFSSISVQNVTNMSTPSGTYAITRGQKQYELSNHLGNVLAVVSDRKNAICSETSKLSATFNSGSTTGWTASYRSSLVSNGSEQINVNGLSGTSQITSPLVAHTVGKKYRLSFDLLNNTPGNYLIVYTMYPYSPYTITWLEANGHYDLYYTAASTNMQVFFNFQNNNSSAPVTFSLDNVKIDEISSTIASYTARVLQANDYSPFGAPLAGRSYDRMEEASRKVLYNDQFTGSTNGWIPMNSITLTHDAGRLKCASSATWGIARKVLNLVSGKQYKLRFRIEMGTATAINIPLYNNAITSYVTMPDVGITITQSGVYEGHFTANDNTMNFLFEVVPGNPTGATFWLDDVVIEEDVTEEKAYALGFNGKESDDEVKGDGNQQDYGMRIYDTRLGKFLSVDPLTKSYAFYTPYQFAGNTPLSAIDLDGEEPKIIVTNKITGYTRQHVYGVDNVKDIIVPTYEAKVVYTDASGKTTEMGTFNVTRDGWFSLGTAANGKAMLSNRSSDPSPKAKPITIERKKSQQYGDGTPSLTMSPIHSPIAKEDNTSYYHNGKPVLALDPEVKRKNNTAEGAQFHVGGVYDDKVGPAENKTLAGAYGCYGVVTPDQVYTSKSKVPEEAKMKGTSNQEMIDFGAAVAAAEAMQMTEHGKPAKVEVEIQTRKYERSKQVTAKP